MIAVICLALCQPAVQLPATINAKPGRLVQIAAKTEQKIVRWFLSAPDDADLIVMESTKTAIFSAVKPGSYRLVAYTAVGDMPSEPAICDIVVAIIPPKPDDSLALALAAIWGALQEPEQVKNKVALTEVYRSANAFDDKLLDLGALNATLLASRRSKVPDDRLVAIRERIGQELATLGNDPSTLLTPELRAKAQGLFTRIATALEVLK